MCWWNQLTSLCYIEYALFHWNSIPSPQIPFRVLCFPEKGYMGIHHTHTSFIGANNWKFTFTITRAASSSAATRGKYEPWSVSGAETGRAEAGDNQRHDQGPGRQHPGHTREKESWSKIKSIPVCINKTWSVKLGAQCFRLWIDDLFSLCNFEQSVMFQSTFCAKFKW